MINAKKHYRQIQKVLLIVLALNWLVAAAKMIYGLISHSASMTADGFHSLADGTSNVIGLIGIYYCSQPKDEDHPYGHKKYETLFALGIAAMLLFVAFNLGKQGIFRFHHPVTPQVDMVSFAVMLITIAVNFTVMIYEYRSGKRLGSDILVVDSMHTKSDIFTSISVLAALIGVKLGYPIVDPIVAILISLFIFRSAFLIIKEESGILCDACAIADTKKIEDIVLAIPSVGRCHKIRTRGRMDDIHLDLHVQIDGNITLNQSHQLSHKIQAEIIKALPQITDVLVHLEPNRN
ncbi:MAG TPA: cation transporter [Phycisphaerales bacterium]|nr:MAG: cation transporter [Planctomycetes bacterium GWC2_45_44]HBG79082.1 cation transporter [Phycisphaerales bacterium]HBR18916.1 cation transporter [Phycisphaerales bacterium]